MQEQVDLIRQAIQKSLPSGSIVPCHDAVGHHYQLIYCPGQPIVDSVTSKGSILEKRYLKTWATKKGVEHIRDNWLRAQQSPAEREIVFLEAENMHTDILNDASDIGNRSHELVEDYLNHWINTKVKPLSIVSFAKADEDSRVISAIRAAEKFIKDRHIIPIYSELLVGSKKYQTAGTLDFLAFQGKELNSGSATCDHDFWATSNGKKHECIHCGLKIKYELVLVDWKSSNDIKKKEYMMQVSTYWECLKECTGLKPRAITIVQLNKRNGDYDFLEVSMKKQKTAFKAFENLTRTYDWLNSQQSEFDPKIKKILTYN